MTTSHTTRIVPNNAGAFRLHRATCETCGPLHEWTTDYDDAKTAQRRHDSLWAADAVVATGVES